MLLCKLNKEYAKDIKLPECYTLQKRSLGSLVFSSKNFKQFIFNIYIYIISKDVTVYIVKDCNGNIVHKSYAISSTMKFKFLKNKDVEIGPCVTDFKHRGKGIYPAVIQSIVKDKGYSNDFYMIVDENNIASIRGIEKAGFMFIGTIIRDGLLCYKEK